jgi:adenylate kinase family enzyme
VLQSSVASKPQITGFLDLAQYSNYTASVVPVDQPLFSVHPPVITFSDFEGLQTYEATITLRNQDNVARRVKVYPPNSPFFDLAAGRGQGRSRKASAGSTGNDEVAPGMEVSYVIRFKPDARIDYTHDLVVITEREKFSVPIRASGGSALLDFPDVVDFGSNCVVGHQSERTVLVRNVGDRATKFVLRTNPPFSIREPDGYLPENASCQVDILFKPEREQSYESELTLRYGELEATATLYGSAANAEVSLSHSHLIIDDTYVGLETQGVVIIRNNSDVPVDFSWRLFPTLEAEEEYRLQLHGQLKHEEREEMLYMMQDKPTEESSDESGSDEERLKVRREAKINSTLSRKYGNISKAVSEDPMLFHDATFSIEPSVGRVWSHSQLMCACSFRPKDALVYSCTAYLACVGQEERAPLVLKGLGIGPKASFSYDELDVNQVFVESAHRYEVQLINQGDIEVDFRLVPREGRFGSRFHFEPSSGTIPVGGQCEITVNFKPTELGDFHEVFDWVLKGSAIGVTLAFKGKSIRPSFNFDVERINFGIVSYGFLNSRMLTLSNTAEVPMRYTLRIIGDDNPPEFDIVPAHGTLLPNCSQRVQVDFVSRKEQTYNLNLAVDLEGVGPELETIPVTAQCAAPQVTFEPHGCLSYGDVFIRYPFHQSLYLHNTSNLPAKFEVMPQEDKSRAEFEPDQWSGSVPPCASHVITVTLTAHTPGPVRVPMYVRIPGRAVPFPLVLVANSIGPRVMVDQQVLDWGSVKCLEPVTRHVRLTNNSCIDASVRAFMNERKSLWSVHPKIIHLSPQETLQLAVTLKIDEAKAEQDILNLIVSESHPQTVTVKAKGVDTPVVSEEQLEVIDFETLFTTHLEPREVVIKNFGQCARRITWFREKEKGEKKDKNKQEVDKPPPIFRVEPENVIMEPKSAYRFTFWAESPNPGYIEETLVCNETLDKGGGPGKQIFKPTLRATFVAPQLKLSTSEIKFAFHWSRDHPVSIMREPLALENTGPLEVGFKVQVEYPFTVDEDEGIIPPHGTQQIMVEFDPSYKTDRKTGVTRKKLTVTYDEHPAVNTVELIGKVVWPNLDLNPADKVDFGIILNETTQFHQVELKNPTPLTVSYQWCLAPLGRNPDEMSNTRGTPGASQASGWARGTAQTAGASTAGGSGVQWASNIVDDDGVSVGASTVNDGGTDIDVNRIFDILPIFGQIPPYSSQTSNITYYGLRDRGFRAQAICMVEGGPEYGLSLKGSAAPCRYGLDKADLDFGDIPFTELGELSLTLSNPGKVPAAFNFNCLGLSRPNVVEVLPSNGLMGAGDRVRVMVRFRAGIPDQVCESVIVEVAHLAPSKLVVRGNGTFPGIVIGLPRQNQEEHKKQVADARRRISTRLDVTGDQQEALAQANAEQAEAVEQVVPGSSAGTEAAEGDGGEPSPRSAVSEEALSVATRRTAPGLLKPTQEDLDLELEVDRHYLCEVLLQTPAIKSPEARDKMNSEMNSTRMTLRSTPTRGNLRSRSGKNEPQQVTAAHYCADFGHIALGQTSRQQVGIYNVSPEQVVITLDKKLLRDNGFLVEPENISRLPPRQMTNITITATRNIEKEGLAELEWNLPVKGGPNYKIQLSANWVLPDLVMSSESLDFGRILVGQRKRITMELKNEKAVPVEWSYVDSKAHRAPSRGGRNETIFDLWPNAGMLMPGESKHVVASFTPVAAQQYNSSLQLRIHVQGNPKRKVIHVTGRGDVLKFDVAPQYSYELGPVMPNDAGCSCEFKIVNPTEYPIEVFSVDFDNGYLEEEKVLTEYDAFEGGYCEVPVRQPGDGTWKRISQRVEKLRARAEREEARACAVAAGEEVPDEEEQEDDADKEQVFEEDVDPDEMDIALYPYRVPAGKRLNALLVGPPKAGMSTVARALANEDKRRALHIDEVFDWALKAPKFLHNDWKARKIVEAVKGGRQPSIDEAAHLLKRRVELADCNAGVILDGIISKYLQPGEVVEAIMEALGSESLVVVGVSLPQADAVPEGTINLDASITVEGGESDETPHPYAAVAEVLNTHYETLVPAAVENANMLRASLPDLEGACKAAADAITAATQATEAGETVEGESESSVKVLEQALRDASRARDQTKLELAECEQLAGWTPDKAAEMFPQPQPPEPAEGEVAEPPPVLPPTVIIAEGYCKRFEVVKAAVEAYNLREMTKQEEHLRDIDRKRRLKKAAAKEAANKSRGRSGKSQAPIDVTTPPGPPPGMEDWVDPVSIAIHDLKDLQDYLKFQEEPVEETEETAEKEPEPKKEKEVLPFKLLAEQTRLAVVLPEIPEEEPLPPSTIVQVLTPPQERKERNPLPNFKILTPIPPTAQAMAEYNAAKAAAAEGEEPECPTATDVGEQTRWIVDPHSEQVLKVHFSAQEVEKYSSTLTFEVVGDNTSGPVSINVSGISALPGIISDPRMIFPKCRKKRPPDGYAVKAFVTGEGVYDFGPLLAGREMTARHPVPVPVAHEEEEDGAVAPKLGDVGSEEDLEPPEPMMVPVSPRKMRHSVDLRITNNSLFQANVTLSLSSTIQGWTPGDPVAGAGAESVPFVVEPSNLMLPVGQSQTVKVWCFPPDKGTFKDTLIASIEHNPEPVTFKLCAIGSIPWAVAYVDKAETTDKADAEKVNFGRIMEKIRADDQFVRLKNDSALPVRWQFICRQVDVIDAEPAPVDPDAEEPPAPKAAPKAAGKKGQEPPPEEEEVVEVPKKIPEEFTLDGTSPPILAPFEERCVRIGFRALKAASYNFVLGLEVQDNEDFRQWQQSGVIDVRAETYAVKVEVDPDPRETALDFGTVLVGSSVERTFSVVNKGLFPVRYVLKPRGKSLIQAIDASSSPTSGTSLPRQLLTIDAPEAELQPAESRLITVKCTPAKMFDLSNDRDGITLQIFDVQSNEPVDHKIPPIRVGVMAVYNNYQITPPRGLNFGPVERDSVKSMSFTLRNSGIFGHDWCLFDPSKPPVFSDKGGVGGPPEISDGSVRSARSL